MKLKCRLLFVLTATLVISCSTVLAGGSSDTRAGSGLLWGIVTRGPVSPVERLGVPSSVPAAGVTVVVSSPDGKTAGTAVTDDEGNYRIGLPPGTFIVNIHRGPLGHASGLPARVTVSEGGRTRLDIRLDTGIR
jgi:hypothetical protein